MQIKTLEDISLKINIFCVYMNNLLIFNLMLNVTYEI